MMNIRQAILVELFSVLLVLFGGFYWLADGRNFQLFVNLGMILGVIGLVFGFMGD